MVLPSDPATEKAAAYLAQQGVAHTVMPIPPEVNYQTGATRGIYITGADHSRLMMDLSAQGFVIMRVFREYEPHAS